MEQLIDSLKGKELNDLTFFEDDHIRLDFSGSILAIYQWPAVIRDAAEIDENAPEYRDVLSGLKNEVVTSIIFIEGTSLTIDFGKAEIRLELADDEETFYFKSGSEWMVG